MKNGLHEFVKTYLKETKSSIESLDLKKIEEAMQMVMEAYKNDKKVFIIGNGGGASTASHMACDLGKGTLNRIYDYKEKRFKVISLTDNVALLTAYANDYSFNDVFIQQLRNLVEKNDLLIVFSGGGNSLNIIKAVKYAKRFGAKTIGFLGFKNGGKLGSLVDCAVIVQSNHYGPIEEAHLALNHIIASWFAQINRVAGKSNKSTNHQAPFRKK